MNHYVTQQLAQQHHAELLREADQARLARAGEATFGVPAKQDRRVRVVLAMAGAAVGILATAATVLGAH